MSAVAYKLPNHSGRPQLRLVPPLAEAAAPVAARRRAILACAALLTVVAVVLVVKDGRGASVNSAAASTAATPPASSWTVRPGDTLWSIARSVQPSGDLRPLVHRLVRAYGERPLHPGETLAIPS